MPGAAWLGRRSSWAGSGSSGSRSATENRTETPGPEKGSIKFHSLLKENFGKVYQCFFFLGGGL